MRGQTWSNTVPAGACVLSAPSQAPDFSSLLERARMGSREAVDGLFAAFRADLLILIRHRLAPGLRMRLEPDDILQITYMRAFEHFPDFRGSERRSLHAWLARIARNVLRDQVDHFRRERRDMYRTLPLNEDIEALPAEGPSPLARLVREEETSRLAEAMATLGDRQRLLILLRTQEDLSFAEIGERLRQSPDACRMTFARALAALTRRLRSTKQVRQLRHDTTDRSPEVATCAS